MARALNRVTLLGNLGQAPELRTTNSGKSVCTLSIATSESYKDNSGEWRETTDWHNVVLWDWMADSAGQYLHKGSRVYIEGKLKTRSYERDGITRYVTEVVAQNFINLDPRPAQQQGDSGPAPLPSYDDYQAASSPQSQNDFDSPDSTDSTDSNDTMKNDVPF